MRQQLRVGRPLLPARPLRDLVFFSRKLEADIRREFRDRLRAPVEVKIRYLTSIPPLKSGKFRYVISEVEQARAMRTESSEQSVSVGVLSS